MRDRLSARLRRLEKFAPVPPPRIAREIPIYDPRYPDDAPPPAPRPAWFDPSRPHYFPDDAADASDTPP